MGTTFDFARPRTSMKLPTAYSTPCSASDRRAPRARRQRVDGVHEAPLVEWVGRCPGRAGVRSAVQARNGGAGADRAAVSRVRPRSTMATIASTVRSSSSSPSSASPRDGRPVTPLVDSAGRGVAEDEVGGAIGVVGRRPGGRGARARARRRASPTSRPGCACTSSPSSTDSRATTLGSAVHQSTMPTCRSGRNRRRWSVAMPSDARCRSAR